MFALSTAGAFSPFNEDKASGDGVDRNSAIIGGKLGTVLKTVET